MCGPKLGQSDHGLILRAEDVKSSVFACGKTRGDFAFFGIAAVRLSSLSHKKRDELPKEHPRHQKKSPNAQWHIRWTGHPPEAGLGSRGARLCRADCAGTGKVVPATPET